MIPESNQRPAPFHLSDPAVLSSVLQAAKLFLFLDLDGTLVPIAPTPAEASLSRERRRCLEELAARPDIMVAIVTGRRLEEAQQLVGVPKIFYVGLHGLEIITVHGEKMSYPVGQEVIDSLRSLRESFAAPVSGIPGMFFEDKGLSLALHFRLAAPEQAREASRGFVHAANSYREKGIPWEILEGKEVIEIKPMGRNKGNAVADLLGRYGQGTVPIYLGDDVTDEAAFASLKPRGITILVSEAPRPTSADYYLRSSDEVYGFLKDLILLRAKKP